MKLKKYTLPFLIVAAIIAAVFICHYKGDDWEEKVRIALYSVKRDSVPSFATEKIDDKGVPYVYYAPQNQIASGTRYNATIVANYALKYYSDFKKSQDSAELNKFTNCIQFLQDSATVTNDSAFYWFHWQQPWYPLVKNSFTSGMTSGRAIEAFVAAFKLYNDSVYLKNAETLLNGFYRSIQDGGFTYKQPEGWWYEEIAQRNTTTPQILDGHIFAILGVQKLYEQTHSLKALTIVQNGLNGLKNELPFYDVGNGKIYYDIYKKTADKKYQKILTAQMQQLWLITKDTTFLNYYNKWNAPMLEDYMWRVLKEKNISGLVLFFFFATISFLILFSLKILAEKIM